MNTYTHTQYDANINNKRNNNHVYTSLTQFDFNLNWIKWILVNNFGRRRLADRSDGRQIKTRLQVNTRQSTARDGSA